MKILLVVLLKIIEISLLIFMPLGIGSLINKIFKLGCCSKVDRWILGLVGVICIPMIYIGLWAFINMNISLATEILQMLRW